MQQHLEFITTECKDGLLGEIILSRPETLNALTHSMIKRLHQQLIEWEQNTKVKAVLIQAVDGKAFCAGGDIRWLYQEGKQGNTDLPHFFWDEYQLNHTIHHYPKPYIAIMNGITMGGGVGISLHGSHRIATENFSFAMPETGIGFFPDIGGGYLLSRCPNSIGEYLGLSGARLNAFDSCEQGLVDHVVASEQTEVLKTALLNIDLSDAQTINLTIKEFASNNLTSRIAEHTETINSCFSHSTVEDIMSALHNQKDEWSLETAKRLLKKSPTSLKVTLHQIQQAGQLNFDECMQMDYRLVNRFIKGHDFYEGVRALIVDKDNEPKWQPAELNDVTDDALAEYFAGLGEQELIFPSTKI